MKECWASVALVRPMRGAAYAEKDRPHEGKITRIDATAMVLTVQEKGRYMGLYYGNHEAQEQPDVRRAKEGDCPLRHRHERRGECS
jgi:hypothetical protein